MKTEKAILCLNFWFRPLSVSITFSIVVLAQVDLMEYFGLYYLTVCLIGIVCAIICPRIPPLSIKKDTYLVEGKAMPESIPDQYSSSFEYGKDLALKRVAEHKGIGEFLENGLKNSVGYVVRRSSYSNGNRNLENACKQHKHFRGSRKAFPAAFEPASGS